MPVDVERSISISGILAGDSGNPAWPGFDNLYRGPNVAELRCSNGIVICFYISMISHTAVGLGTNSAF